MNHILIAMIERFIKIFFNKLVMRRIPKRARQVKGRWVDRKLYWKKKCNGLAVSWLKLLRSSINYQLQRTVVYEICRDEGKRNCKDTEIHVPFMFKKCLTESFFDVL